MNKLHNFSYKLQATLQNAVNYKLVLVTVTMFCAITYTKGQSQNWWRTNGNTPGVGDILGTTNAQPINFATNSTVKMVLDASGNLRLINFAGAGNRVVLTDVNGNFVALPQGTAGQFLSSNGTWQNLPVVATTFSNTGLDIFIPSSSKFGIGTSAPTVPLEVVGNAKISNNITVGNKLILGTATSKIGISYSPATPTSPSILNFGGDEFTSTPATWGPCNFLGAVPPTITTFGGLIQTYNVDASNNYVTGSTVFDIGANAGGAFLNSKFAPLYVNADCNSDIYLMGTKIGFGTATPSERFHFYSGNFLLEAFPSNPAVSIFSIKNSVSNSINFNILAEGTVGFGTNIASNTGGAEYKFHQGALRLTGTNTFGGPQLIFGGATSPFGDWGIEYTGGTSAPNLGLNFWKPFGSTSSNNYILFLADNNRIGMGTDAPSTRLTIDAWNEDGLLIKTDPNKNVIDVFNKSTNKTEFRIKANGEVYARHVKVMITNFPDYVFEKGYKMLSLYDIEKYYLLYKHLPEIPTAADVEANNLDLGDMNKLLLKKIEEMTILMVELKKEVDELKKTK